MKNATFAAWVSVFFFAGCFLGAMTMAVITSGGTKTTDYAATIAKIVETNIQETFSAAITQAFTPTGTAILVQTQAIQVVTADPLSGVTAICNDGTYSYSKGVSGTCSYHGGVKEWINRP